MRRIVPSQICDFIDRLFPGHAAVPADEHARIALKNGDAPALLTLVEMLNAVPDELLPDSAIDVERITSAKHAITAAILRWNAGDGSYLYHVRTYREGPLRMIYEAFKPCPDERPSKTSTHLDFLRDPQLANSIRTDESAASRALANGDWKSATVLAGAAIEALLLACLQQPAVFTSIAKMPKPPRTPRDMEKWSLHELISAANGAGILTSRTLKQVELAQDFRNLIHPGRAQRLGQRCDRGTAYGALAGLDLTVSDVQKHFP